LAEKREEKQPIESEKILEGKKEAMEDYFQKLISSQINVAIDRITKVLESKTQSTEIDKLAAALAKAQGTIVNASKDTENTYFKSKYAPLSAIWDACRKQLSENGLSVVQTIKQSNGIQSVTLITIMMHSSGQWVKGEMTAVTEKPGPQALGSLITYLRRYQLAAMVGVAPEGEDDDGQSAHGQTEKQKDDKKSQKSNTHDLKKAAMEKTDQLITKRLGAYLFAEYDNDRNAVQGAVEDLSGGKFRLLTGNKTTPEDRLEIFNKLKDQIESYEKGGKTDGEGNAE